EFALTHCDPDWFGLILENLHVLRMISDHAEGLVTSKVPRNLQEIPDWLHGAPQDSILSVGDDVLSAQDAYQTVQLDSLHMALELDQFSREQILQSELKKEEKDSEEVPSSSSSMSLNI